MSLDGAKLICLGNDPLENKHVILAKGKTFKFGYYMDCDVVLEHSDALGLHCTIDCDAFGRVTIANLCKDQDITLNGKPLKKLRPLLHNTEICILDKKFLWVFEKDEDLIECATPSQQPKKAAQPPNSEPGRRWRTHDNRLTIHTFSYSIKSGKESQTEETQSERNIAQHTCQTMDENKSNPPLTKILSPVPSEMDDLIDLKTPKPKQKSFAGQKTPLISCSFSETVITSYSPRNASVHAQVKSYAVVQSPLSTPRKLLTQSDVTLGQFKQTSSPLVLNQRPSMHLIDLTTPIKRAAPKSPFKVIQKNKLGQKKAANSSADSTSSTVFSVHSTDEESVIELSDDGSFSPSPVLKTPPRSRTPQSLMKRAILSSAKKVIRKPLQPPAAPPPLTPSTPKSPTTARVRFQSLSTPQRKSLASTDCSSEKASKSVVGTLTNSMVTSTPFRADQVERPKRRSSILRSPSSSLMQSSNKSRTSLMLRQVLTASPKHKSEKTSLRKESLGNLSHDKIKLSKSVSFLEQSADCTSNVNKTFSIEEIQDCTNEAEGTSNSVSTPRKNATFSPEKQTTDNLTDDCVVASLDETADEKVLEREETKEPEIINKESKSRPITNSSVVAETRIKTDTNKGSSIKPLSCVTSNSKRKSTTVDVSSTTLDSPRKSEYSHGEIETQPNTYIDNTHLFSVQQTPQSSKGRLRKTPLSIKPSSAKNLRNIIDEEDFEGLESVFKTPKARNLMILSSPKSVALKKTTTDSLELMHSTQFDLSTNLDVLFKTPQSELTINRAETTITALGSANDAVTPTLSPEEAFENLVGRSTVEKNYSRKKSAKQNVILPLDTPRDPDLPKTDIQEWIETVNQSIKHSEVDREEIEISYITADQGEVTRDPLMMSTISEGVPTTNKKQVMDKSLADEIAMTVGKVGLLNDTSRGTHLKDPLEVTIVTQSKKPMSPNISGIDLLDHTSESAFSETLAISDDSSEKENVQHIVSVTLDDTMTQIDAQISPKKAKREMEEAFENFEKERKILEDRRLVSTPEPKKTEVQIKYENRRKTLANSVAMDSSFDVKSAKQKWEMELAFENFEEKPVLLASKSAKTPDAKKSSLKDHRRTVGTKFVPEKELDLEAAKEEREKELAFENFEEDPVINANRAAKTPDDKKSYLKDHRRTMGTKFVPEKELDLEAAKEEREMELAFENFQEGPVLVASRAAKTPDAKKSSMKDHRRTMGTKFVPEKELDVEAAKEEREMELAFENFQEEPVLVANRAAKTPDAKKSSLKDHRLTMGTKFVPEKELDLEAAKEEREMELAFENFQEGPVLVACRAAKTPDAKKSSMKDHRRTMGTKFVPEKELDLEAAKEEREMELAFENFEEDPVINANRAAKTPDAKKSSLKDHRRTMGTNFVPEKELDLEAAKEEREMELAFENFQEGPVLVANRAAKTPDAKKSSLKDHRRTMGTKFVPEKELDLEAAKEEREMELAFENFEEDPVINANRAAKTPDAKKSSLKDHRRTMGTKFVPEKELDLEAAKEEREMELAFENFQEGPVLVANRAAKTPDAKKSSLKDHRRTMGTKFVPEKELDLEAAKEEREMELAFENFQEEPVLVANRAARTPDAKKSSLKDHRRTMGTKFVPEKELDLEAAKEEREMELAFENFQEEPVLVANRAAKTPDAKKSSLKDHRRTMGTKFVPEKELDLEAAKEEREMELAFENFQEGPVLVANRATKTPDAKKSSLKDHRRTMGTKFVPEKELDLEAAKEERDMELAFENFEEDPVINANRAAKTPDGKKSYLKDHRRTMGTKFVPEKELDLEAAKEEREMELAFENFQEEPVLVANRAAKTPDAKKSSLKDHRRTMGTKFVPEKELDLEAAKEEREMELAFENFQEEPVLVANRAAKTPDAKKSSLKDHRRTMGTKFVPEKELDLEAAKEEREMELAFENFQEGPVLVANRATKTPDAKKSSLKDHRRTMGTKFVPEKELDLEAAKEEREMELAFENFEEDPVINANRAAKTPDAKKSSLKDHRRTMGTKFVPEKELDLEAAKEEREMELAFENVQEKPVLVANRAAKTPDAKKSSLKDHRRTMGTKFVPEKELDLEAAKEERERELAFENFEEDPVINANRAAKTPDAKKSSLKDHRRTMGTKFVPEKELDLEAAKEEREMELAFENFQEGPVLVASRAAKTPDAKKSSMKDHRRTMGTKFVPEKELDLEAAKEEREMELAFENEMESVAEVSRDQTKLKACITSPDKANQNSEVKSYKSFDAFSDSVKKESDSIDQEIGIAGKAAHDTNSTGPNKRALRRRQNSVDEKNVIKRSESLRATRKMLTSSDIENVPERTVEDIETSLETQKSQAECGIRNRNVVGKKTETQIESTDVESECTDDEENGERPTRRKRGLKVKSIKSLQSHEEENQHIEPIIEEVKKQDSIEESALKEAPAQPEHTKVSLNLQAEVEKDMSDLNKCTRSVALNVVLLKSSSSQVQNAIHNAKLQNENEFVRDFENPQIKRELDEFKDEIAKKNETIEKESLDIDEVISSTPVPKGNQRRRPQKKPESPKGIGSLGLRRTRRGSVQQDIDMKFEPVDAVELSHSTPLRSLFNLKTDVIPSTAEKSTPVKRRGRKPAEVEDIGEVIPSTPLPPKTRGRRAIQKPGGTSTTRLNEDTKAFDERGVNLASASGHIAPTEEIDEIVPSTPLQEVRRGRRVKSVKKLDSNPLPEETLELVSLGETIVKIEIDAHEEESSQEMQSVPVPIQGTETEGLNKSVKTVCKSRHDSKTVQHDMDAPLNINREGKVEHVVELTEISKESRVASKTRGRKAAATLTENKPRRRGVVELAAKDPSATSVEIEKIGCKNEEVFAEEAVSERVSAVKDLTEFNKTPQADQSSLPTKNVGRNRDLSETIENHFVEKEEGEYEIKLLPSSATTAKTRSRRNANKEEQPKAVAENSIKETQPKSKLPAKVRSQGTASTSDQTDAKSPLGKRVRGRLPKGAAPVDDNLEKIKIEELPPVEQELETQTEDEDTIALPSGKRCRIMNANTESKESEVSTSADADLPENDFADPSKAEALGNKKRARVEAVKSHLSESKTQSPLRKRGRRQENNSTKSEPTQAASNSELVVLDQDTKLDSDQIIPEKEEKTDIVAAKRGRGRKLVSETLPDKLKIDSEIVKEESQTTSEKRPVRSRRAGVKEVLPIEEVGDKLQSGEKSADVESKNTQSSESTSENKPTRSRRAPVKDDESMEVFSSQIVESKNIKQETADEPLIIKSEEKISTRSRRAPPKSSANISTSYVNEDITHKNPLEILDAEDINEKTSTRTRNVATKNNASIEVSPLRGVATVKIESEENLKTRTARPRRLPAKYNTSVEVSSSHTDDEHQKLKPSTGRTRKAASKTTPEDTDANTSQHSTAAVVPHIEDEHKEPEIAPKTTRGRKIAQIQDPKIDEKHTPTIRSRRPVAKIDTAEDASKTASVDADANTSQHNKTAEVPCILDEHKGPEILPKTTRGRKLAQMQDPKVDEKLTPTIRIRRPVAKIDTEDEAVEKQIQRQTRGKRVAKSKPEISAANSSKVILEEKESLPKRTTRTRKAATQNEPSESEGEDHQKDSIKKPTRSRKITEPALEDEAKGSKRGNRHLQEVLPDDSSSTPKRTRRKLRT